MMDQDIPSKTSDDLDAAVSKGNINCWLGVWGLLQGSVGKFLDCCIFVMYLCIQLLYRTGSFHIFVSNFRLFLFYSSGANQVAL